MTYREPWDTADNADSQMARYPRNREGERARRPPPPSLFTNKTSYHHYHHHMQSLPLQRRNRNFREVGLLASVGTSRAQQRSRVVIRPATRGSPLASRPEGCFHATVAAAKYLPLHLVASRRADSSVNHTGSTIAAHQHSITVSLQVVKSKF